MSFELPSRQGRAKKPIPPVSIGARRRGKARKLTPYVMFTTEAAQALFGSDSGGVLQLAVGTQDHEGWIRLNADPEGNVTLRPPSGVNKDLVVETVLIPHDGKSQLRRVEAEIDVKGQNLFIKLPWGAKRQKKEKSL